MSKLNLINLAKDEISKEEAQKAKGGVLCICDCICLCSTDYPTNSTRTDSRDNTRMTIDNM